MFIEEVLSQSYFSQQKVINSLCPLDGMAYYGANGTTQQPPNNSDINLYLLTWENVLQTLFWQTVGY